MTLLQELDPATTTGATLTPRGEAFVFDGYELSVYDIPLPEDPEAMSAAGMDRLATNNFDGFSRLVNGGADALEDSESVVFALSSEYGRLSTVRSVTRLGDNFEIREVATDDKTELVKQDAVVNDEQILDLKADDVRDFMAGFRENVVYLNYMAELIDRGDELAGTVKAIGYSDNNEVYPLPAVLKSNIKRVREEGGIPIPNVRLLDSRAIDGDTYNQAWADGEFPMSRDLSWYGHDGFQDHERALMVLGDEAMDFGRMFAQSGGDMSSITVREYPDEYEINAEDPQKIEVVVEGDAKTAALAIRLDQFTAELDGLVGNGALDMEPFRDELVLRPLHFDVVDEMATVIMSSPTHKQEFTEYLRKLDSKAMQSGEFDYEVFLREMLDRAQKRWHITPKKPTPVETNKSNSLI